MGKFDIIYPKEKPLGYCGQEAIWPRSAVHHLHTLDGWLKEGREVRVGEAPIKRVPKRKRKNNKEGTGEELKELDTELFGLWCVSTVCVRVLCRSSAPTKANGALPASRGGRRRRS